ncbi:hypothetical protein TRIP_C20809 [Candidatus Zixiibacteriota bacterium]|nr:hypothetical protein TRIP_C20809 [candidate division Zixibacteria bacterium]
MKIIKPLSWACLTITIFLAIPLYAKTPRGVEFELIVRQKPAEIDKYFEVARDTVQVITGKKLHTFMVNFRLDLDVPQADSQSALFTADLVTVGVTPFNYAKQYRVEYNLSARIENIPGKNGSIYQLLISPRGLVDISAPPCEYDPDLTDQFTTEPSANFQIYCVPNSLADYRWNNIKNYLETEYTRFRSAFDFNSPGQMNLFLLPCPSSSVNWDKRFGYMLDPGRGSIYTIYNHGYISTDAMLPNMLKLLRIWGYAPPFVVEGLAGYFEFWPYEMKKIAREGKIPEIKNILTTEGYYAIDPVTAEITAGSFMKFIADKYGMNAVRRIYKESDDLTLANNLQKICQISLDSLQAEWTHYVDTLELNRRQFDFYAARAGATFRIDQQIEYYREMTKYDSNRADSIDTWKKLAAVCYQFGRYYDALDGYRLLVKLDSARSIYYQILGNLYLIDGQYDQAWSALDTVLLKDSTYATARLLQAKITAIRGDTAGAIRIAEKVYDIEKSVPGKIEFLLFMGKMEGSPGVWRDTAKAENHFSEALGMTLQMMAQIPDDPTYKIRAGLASLGLHEYDKAGQYLDVAYFTEQRSYYLGEVLLALGNLEDLQGKRKAATEYYQQGLRLPLAVYQRDLCTKYIDKAYHL